ncbi:hypothetical protein VNO78_13768 [Psophocarpus tetragonolobus]|uniref:Uncharacterized protein n=1 Tax=Psophocarpus tetragonolobus TaxID=3891 RepID=A0AAN9SPH4_PSOTE
MSSLRKAPSSNNMTSEESGWTKYFDEQRKCSLSFSGVDSYSTSFVSDSATKILTDTTQAYESSFKKRKKIKTVFVDDSLEDTATSPVKSPNPKENGKTPGERDERKEMCFNTRDNDHTELKKKKGLCLVPISMIVKYLG